MAQNENQSLGLAIYKDIRPFIGYLVVLVGIGLLCIIVIDGEDTPGKFAITTQNGFDYEHSAIVQFGSWSMNVAGKTYSFKNLNNIISVRILEVKESSFWEPQRVHLEVKLASGWKLTGSSKTFPHSIKIISPELGKVSIPTELLSVIESEN